MQRIVLIPHVEASSPISLPESHFGLRCVHLQQALHCFGSFVFGAAGRLPFEEAGTQT
jgi:hypothetical protein